MTDQQRREANLQDARERIERHLPNATDEQRRAANLANARGRISRREAAEGTGRT